MKFQEFIAEISTDLSSFSEDGSIDEISIKKWIITELKSFGVDVLPLQEKIIQIQNSQGEFPDTFRAMKMAIKLEPFGHTIQGSREELEGSFIYRARIEHPAYFNEVTKEYITSCKTKIIEDVVTIGNSKASFYYNSPSFLSLSPNIKKDGLSSDCLNMSSQIRNSSPYEISIVGHTIFTNFREGTIYTQFYALPTDEEGEIMIPESRTGALEKYLEFYVKSRIAENLIANNRNPQGLTQLLTMYLAERKINKTIAQTEARFKGAGKWAENFKILNQRDMAVFNLS